MRLLKLVLAGTLATNSLAAFAHEPAPVNCLPELSLTSGIPDQLREEPAIRQQRVRRASAFRDLKRYLPQLFAEIETKDYYQVLRRLLAASLVRDGGMLLTAIIGPASMGKSTVANAIWALATENSEYLPDDQVSRVGPKPGLTVRPLVFVAKGDSEAKRLVMRGLRARYGDFEIYRDVDDPTRAGPPLLVELDRLNDITLQPFVDTPDMTTGDPQTDLGPVHQKAARDALLPAEVLLILLKDYNMRDFPLREMLMQNFKKFGMRKTIFVVRTDAETDKEFAELREWLVESVNSIYGFRPDQKKEFDEAVLGMYAMQEKRAVRLGTEHPKLVPFAGSDHFASLMTDMAKNAGEIRGFAGKKAAELVYEQIGKDIDTKDVQLQVKQIYSKALAEAMKIGPNSVDFPYEEARDQWRALFGEQTPTPTRYLDKSAEVAVKMLKKIPNMRVAEKPLSEVLNEFDAALKASWENRVASILADLGKDEVRLPATPGQELKQMIERFNEEHREHAVSDLVVQQGSVMKIKLPSSKLLKQDDRVQLEAVTKKSAQDVLRAMTETKPDQEVHLVKVDEVTKGLREILDNKYDAKAKGRDIGLDLVTTTISVGGPLTAALKVGLCVLGTTVSGGSVLVAVAAAAASNVGMGFLRKWREGMTDVDLKPKLVDWFKKNQDDEFKARLDQHLLRDLRLQLARGVTGSEAKALRRVRFALATLLAKPGEEPVLDEKESCYARAKSKADALACEKAE